MQNEPTEQRYMPASELVARFHRSRRTLDNWIASRGFPPAVISGSGGQNLWLRSEVEEWEAGLRNIESQKRLP